MTLSDGSQQILTRIRYSEVARIISCIGDMPYAVLKGEPLSKLCYGSECMRETSDVDFLIMKKDIAVFEELLEGCGFSPVKKVSETEKRRNRLVCLTGSHQISSYSKTVFNIPVLIDINFDVYWGEYNGKRIPVKEFLANTVETEVCGIRLKTLSPVYAFIQLVLHHYREMNSVYHLLSHKTIVAQKIDDIQLLYTKLYDIGDLNELYRVADKYDLGKYIFYMLYWSSAVNSSDILSMGVERYHSKEGESLLDTYGLSDRERKTWTVEFTERLNSDKIPVIIRSQLTSSDLKKYEREVRIFG